MLASAYSSTTEQKRAFANDLLNPLTVLAVDDGQNQAKSDRHPAEWLPPNLANRCEYVRNWVAVKQAYGLTIDPIEQFAIDSVIKAGASIPTQASAARAHQLGILVDATFSIGMTRNDNCGFERNARVFDEVSISGVIKPQQKHIGRQGNIYLVDRVNISSFQMQDATGNFVPWDGYVATLTPARTNVTLTEVLSLEIFTGVLSIPGDHRLFLGYMADDGQLIYTPIAIPMTINE